ncbi:MAG: phage tail protein [Pseudanabaena sp.]|jgi:phage tail-like protein
MADGEVLACSKYYFWLQGIENLIVKKVSGIGTTLQTAGDSKSFGVGLGGTSVIQATVTGVTNSKITVEFVCTVGDTRLEKWYSASHSEPIKGGGSQSKGERKTGRIVLYNQGGEEAAEWSLVGIMPASYKSSKFEAGAEGLATETVEFVYQSLHRTK